MRFIHAADLHLDSPLAGIARRGEIATDILRDCTRRALTALVQLARDERVDFVVIAGDIYDGDWKDYTTGLFFAEQMAALPCPCIILRGNHDARSQITRSLTLPANVQEFSTRSAHTLTLDDLGVALHGRSYPDRAVPEDISASYPARVEGMFNIGVLHTSAEEPVRSAGGAHRGAHDRYAPCSVQALVAKGYDYWALGHIHDRRVLNETPWIGFSGNIQGRHVNEPGAKGCYLVEVLDGRIDTVAFRPLDVVRWATVEVAATGIATLDDVAGPVRAALAEAAIGAEGRPLVARIVLTGTSPAHAALLADPERLDAECRLAAIGVGGVHIESARLATSAIPQAPGEDELAQLEAEVRGALAADPGLAEGLAREFRALAQQLPRAARPEQAALPDTAEAVAALVDDAWAEIAQALAEAQPVAAA